MVRIHHVYLLIAIALLSSCSKPAGNHQEASVNEPATIQITRQQFDLEQMELGEARRMPFRETVAATGQVVANPNGIAMVSAPVGGVIHSIRCQVGQFVEKGAPLFDVSGNEVIDIQRSFAEAASLRRRLKSEYDRIKTLYDEQIGSEKDFIQAESDYTMAQAAYSALKLKLEAMGMDVKAIEQGGFARSFVVTASIKGYVSEVEVSTGQFVDPQMVLAKVIDPARLQVRLAFFEKDLGKVKEGQSVEFGLIQNPEQTFKAVLSALGKTVDADTRTISGYARIVDGQSNEFVNNTFVEARIITEVDTVLAVPEEAILKSDDAFYVLSLASDEEEVFHFNCIKVNVGRVDEGYAEVSSDSDLGQIITHGVYNVLVE